MRALVTGAAGFIGTQLVGHLLDSGWDVLGVDARDPASTSRHLRLRRARIDLVAADPQSLDRLCEGVDVIFHLAGQTGVRSSWADGFARCSRDNIDATQRLLEAARRHPVGRFVFASSSSVYGTGVGRRVSEACRANHGHSADVPRDDRACEVSREGCRVSEACRANHGHGADVPRDDRAGEVSREGCRVSEADPAVPHSPYGVTKLAAELLCRAYAANFGVPTVSLRYFTVYGPGQRPDMSIHRMIRGALGYEPFHLYGDGGQSREFTFVTDVVRATALAATATLPGGAVINVSGGAAQSITDTIRLVESAVGRPVPLVRGKAKPGDVQVVSANLERARSLLGWQPRVPFALGLQRQVDAERALLARLETAPETRLVS